MVEKDLDTMWEPEKQSWWLIVPVKDSKATKHRNGGPQATKKDKEHLQNSLFFSYKNDLLKLLVQKNT